MKLALLNLLCITAVLISLNAKAQEPVGGFNSLLIGHSFFRPYAELMPDYVPAAGIAGHSQTIVFSGGASGTPEALWNNASKKLAITNALDTGDVELFGMTYHPDYPNTTGYFNWINYALDKNPSTRIFVALPWIPEPSNYEDELYEYIWEEYKPSWHSFIDQLRFLFPSTDIFCIPYGQSAVELRKHYTAGDLPEVTAMQGAKSTSIFTDKLGHPGNVLIDQGILVWLSAIYDVDLSNYSYGPTYSMDLKLTAHSIMSNHDSDYNAAYLVDSDVDGVGDRIDNCPLIKNAGQLDTSGSGRGDACEGLPPGC